jgi:hypothetical protein
MGASTYSYAGGFIINVPKTVKQGETASIEVKTDQSSARAVHLSVTTREGTVNYDINLVHGVGKQDYKFDKAGSVILKAANSADAKEFTTKSLHVQFVPGGK